MLLLAGEFAAAQKQCLVLSESAQRSGRLLHCAIAHRSDLLCATMTGEYERAVRDCFPCYLQLAQRDIGGGAMMLPLSRAIYATACVRLWQRGDRADPQLLRQSAALLLDVLKALDKITVLFMRRAYVLSIYLDAALTLFADVAFVASQVPETRAQLQASLSAAAPMATAIAARLLEAYPPDRRTGTPAAHLWAGLLPLALAESRGERLADDAIAAARQQLDSAHAEAQLRLHRPMQARALAALATLAAHASDRSGADECGQRARAMGVPVPFWLSSLGRPLS